MSKTSCIRHPESEPLIIIHQWQVAACDGNTCAAALLSLFEYYHNLKLEQRAKALEANDIAEQHSDSRAQDETLWQFHTEEQLEQRIFVYKRGMIRPALQLLEDRGFITVSNNPNPRYKFDRTRFFYFRPDEVNAWLKTYSERADLPSRKNEGRSRNFASSSLENDGSSCKNNPPSIKSSSPSSNIEAPSRKTEGTIQESSYKNSYQSTHTTHTPPARVRTSGNHAVCVSVPSEYSLEVCLRFAEHLHKTGQGITNPGGYATIIHRTGEADALIKKFLNPQAAPPPPEASDCPDCTGTGWWYPKGPERGIAKCKHARLQAEVDPRTTNSEQQSGTAPLPP